MTEAQGVLIHFVLGMNTTMTHPREARVVQLPPFTTSVNATATGWKQFLRENSSEVAELLQYAAEQPDDAPLDSMTVVSGGEWPSLVPESRMSRGLWDAARRQATLHHMQQYARAHPALVLPTFEALHMLHPSHEMVDDCMAQRSDTLGEPRAAIACSCDDVGNGVRAFDTLAFVLRRLLSPSAATTIPPHLEADLWVSVWSSGYCRLLSVFFAAHGDWLLMGRLEGDTAGAYLNTLSALVDTSFTLVGDPGGGLTLVDKSALSGSMGHTTAEVLSSVLLYDIHASWVTMNVIRDPEVQRRWLPFLLLHLHTEQHTESRSVLADVLRGFFVELRLHPVTPCSVPLLLFLMQLGRGRSPLPGFVQVWGSLKPAGSLMVKHHARIVDPLAPSNSPSVNASGPPLIVIHHDDFQAASHRKEMMAECHDGGVVAVVGTNEQAPPELAETHRVTTLRHTVCHGTGECTHFVAHLLQSSIAISEPALQSSVSYSEVP